jgi:DNA-directed RNA polymerase subunit F
LGIKPVAALKRSPFAPHGGAFHSHQNNQKIMKEKLLKLIDKLFDLPEDKEKKTLNEILRMANEQPDELKQIVKELEQDEISFVYEALALDMDNWSDFFLDEAKRILEKAKQSYEPERVLRYLDEFIFIEPNEFKHSKELVDLMKAELDHENPAFRYWALSIISDFMEEGDYITSKLIEKRLSDTDWRIRYWTYTLLKEKKEKAKYKLSLIDKIRAKILDPYTFF